jgi:hypothetical protein
MSPARIPSATGPLLAAAMLLALAGCAGSPPLDPETRDGRPGDATSDPASPELEVVWRDDGRIDVLTWGSSSCPAVPWAATDDRPARIELRTSGGDTCTADMAPTNSTIDAPDGWEQEGEVTVETEGDVSWLVLEG